MNSGLFVPRPLRQGVHSGQWFVSFWARGTLRGIGQWFVPRPLDQGRPWGEGGRTVALIGLNQWLF
jgi:hypothetical protein